MVSRAGWRYFDAAAADAAGRGRRSLVVLRAVDAGRIEEAEREVELGRRKADLSSDGLL